VELVEPIPEALEKHLRQELQPGELVMVLLAADLDREGNFADSWLALTDERLIVLHPNGGSEPEIEAVFLRDIQKIHTKNYVGNGALVVDLPGETREIVRFSQGAYYKFSGIPLAVEAALADPLSHEAEIDPPALAPPKVDHCKTCGRALRPDTTICINCIRKSETFSRLFTYVKQYRGVAVIGFVLTLALTGFSLVPPWLNKILIDDVLFPVSAAYLKASEAEQSVGAAVTESARQQAQEVALSTADHAQALVAESGPTLGWLVIVLLGLFIVRTLMGSARQYTLGWLGQRVVYDLQTAVFGHLQLLSLNYYNRVSTGRIMTRVTGDTDRMRNFITVGFQDMAISILTLIGIGGTLFYLNWRLALLALIPTPFMVAGTLLYRSRVHWVFHRIWRRISELNSQLADTIPGVKVVKSFAQENRENRRFDNKNMQLRQSLMAQVKMKATFMPAITFTTSVGSVILWYFGGGMVLGDRMSLGELQQFIAYMTMFHQPVRDLCMLSESLEEAATSAERVFEVLDTELDVEDQPKAIDPGVIEGKIEFRDVSFTYDGLARILDRVSFTVEPGEMIGIVGHSGAGKSTLANLASRFYDATDGEILIDDRPIKELQQQRVRAQIGVVLQEPLLFQGTIAENIAYGKPDATPMQIMESARASNAHQFIMNFPDGYDTQVGERGGRLSGGERQRISIARALIGDPRILIMDEATSSVDTETESEIQQALSRLIANRTTIAIAHRLSTLKNADRLIVMDKGRIVEVGSHKELMQREDGTYKRLVDIQTRLTKLV
jgi:ATP-binding cassette subfamily B protein